MNPLSWLKKKQPPSAVVEPAMDYAAARQKMVAEQLAAPARGITDRRVLEAMAKVPRHEFVPEDLRTEAYEDNPLPLGLGQTISQPLVVAAMTQALAPKPTDRVLEIGAGCGYQTAVLSQLVAEVFAVEIIESLAIAARERCARLGYYNVHIKSGDGHAGWLEHAPFDSIIVACAPEAVPPALVQQLKIGGRLVIPTGLPDQQALWLLVKEDEGTTTRHLMDVKFVPMRGT